MDLTQELVKTSQSAFPLQGSNNEICSLLPFDAEFSKLRPPYAANII